MFLKALRLLVVTLTANVGFKLRVRQNGKWGENNTSKQFLWIKLAWKYYFLEEVIDGKKGNLGHVVQIHVCRQISLMTSLRTQTAYFRKIRLRSKANIDQHYPKKCRYRGNVIQYFYVAEKKEKKLWKSRVFFISIKAQNYYFFISQRLCVVSNKTKEPSVKSTTPPGLEPGIFWSEVRRLIH